MIVGPRLFYILLCGGFFFFTTNAETVPVSPLNCDPDEWFKCLDGICVMRSWLCDGEPDCLDGSDEVDCPAIEQKDQAERSEQSMIHDGEDFVETGFGHCNLTTEFQCNETILCIPRYWICDGNVSHIQFFSGLSGRRHHPDPISGRKFI